MLIWIAGICAVIFVGVLLYALCSIAGDADDREERLLNSINNERGKK